MGSIPKLISTPSWGKRSLSAGFSEKKFQEMMRVRETELNHFLQTGGMIGT